MMRNDSAPTARGKTRKRTPLSILAAVAGVIALVAASLAFAGPASATGEPPEKVAVCHYVPGEGNTPANWTYIPSMSWMGWINGHSDHVGDKYGPENGTIEDCGQLPPPPCDLTTHDWWNDQCVPKCPADEIRNEQTGECEAPDHHADVWMYCTDGWFVNLTGFTDMLEAPVVVRLDSDTVAQGVIQQDGSFSASGPTEFTGGSHTITVYVDEVKVGENGVRCGEGTEFTGNASRTLTQQICYAGATYNPTVTEFGQGTSDVDQATADVAAQTSANTKADAAMAIELAKYPGYAVGACPPGQTPPSTPPPAETVVTPEPATVVSPEAATVPQFVPAPKPAKTPVTPEKATVPAAVPAGGGSSSDENAPNGLLLLVAVAASMVCLGATTRLVVTRSR